MPTTGPYLPALPVTGTDITTSGFGDVVVRALRWLSGNPLSGDTERPQAKLYQAVAQSVANATETAVLLDSEEQDTANAHSTTSNTSRWTCPSWGGGEYNLGGNAIYAANASGFRQTKLRINGTTVAAIECTNAVNGNATAHSLSQKVQLNAGDYVELTVYQTSGGSLNTFTGGPYCTLAVEQCRAQ